MLYTTVLSYCVLSAFSLISVGLAAPIAGHLGSQSFFRQLVVGPTPIQAIPIARPVDYHHTVSLAAEPTYLNVAAPWGAPGKATIKKGSAPSFFISHEKLFLYTNDTYILPVNILNSTIPDNPPLKLAVGTTYEGVQGVSWRWYGTLLAYKLGKRSGGALFYSCAEKDGTPGLYTSLELFSAHSGCSTVKLRATEWQEKRTDD
jgi:hypothetical protein